MWDALWFEEEKILAHGVLEVETGSWPFSAP